MSVPAETAFQRTAAKLSADEIAYICDSMKKNQLKLLCLRECKLDSKDLDHVLKTIGSCQSLQQLTLSIGMVTTLHHIKSLSRCLRNNKSLTGLQ